MQVGDMVRRAAQRYGDAIAIEHGQTQLSFREFDQATDRLGNALLARGLTPGDRVGVLLPNGVEGLIAYYALAKSGLVRMSLNVRDTRDDHAYKLSDSGCRALISDGTDDFGLDLIGLEEMQKHVDDGPAEPCDMARPAEAPYRLGFTGGTTGRPKAVTLTMRGEHAEVANYLIDLVPGIRPGDTMLHAAPVTHASGSFFLPHLLCGARSVVLPRWDTSAFLEALERTRATATFLVPTMIAMLLDDPNVEDVDSPALRRLCYGASPIAPSVAERAQVVFGQVLAQTYGQAEAPMTITVLQPDEHDRVGSAGRAYTLAEVRVFDDEDREVPPGDPGEIVCRGQHLMTGYWNRPEETAKALRGGWLHTGDIGRMDDEGYFYLMDRRNDVIISGGFNVYPREVEDALLAHPAVSEAAVVSLTDERWGEVVHAVVATRAAVSEQDILDHAAQRLAGYKQPRGLEIWDALPKSAAGKILRREVRDRVRARVSAARAHGERS